MTSEEIAAKTEKINRLEHKDKGHEQKEKRLVYSELEEKAKEFVEMRIKKKNEKFQLRKYLNDLFETMYKEHKEFIRDRIWFWFDLKSFAIDFDLISNQKILICHSSVERQV